MATTETQTYRIENSARRGYFRVLDGRCGAVVRDEMLWAEALKLRRMLELGLPTFRAAREDGYGDD